MHTIIYKICYAYFFLKFVCLEVKDNIFLYENSSDNFMQKIYEGSNLEFMEFILIDSSLTNNLNMSEI